jgi:proline iminopeptidase
VSEHLDYIGRPERISGEVRMIPVDTPKGRFRVWTKRIGNNPRIKAAAAAWWAWDNP